VISSNSIIPEKKSPLPGLVPGIHVFAETEFGVEEDVSRRVKPGHGVPMG